MQAAEKLANEVIAEDRPVEIRFATPDEARTMGVRKIPPAEREKLRLIDIRDFDLNACGGTHVRSTGQIGCILLRKTEKVKQGVRVEFVCGLRAVATARRDFETLTEAAARVLDSYLGSPAAGSQVAGRDQGRAEGAASNCWKKSPSCRPTQLLQAATDAASASKAGGAVLCRSRSRASSRCWRRSSRAAGQCVALLVAEARSRRWSSRRRRACRNDMGALMKQTVQTAGHARRRQSRHGAGRRARCRARRTCRLEAAERANRRGEDEPL